MIDEWVNELTKAGGPAFPTHDLVGSGGKITFHGMTLRDYFAAAALTSMLSQPDKIGDSTYEKAATLSFKFADAMLKAREAKSREAVKS